MLNKLMMSCKSFRQITDVPGVLKWIKQECDEICERVVEHEKMYQRRPKSIKLHYPHYNLMWRVDPEATQKLIEAIWSAHVLDWSNLDHDRGGLMDENLEEPTRIYKK